MARARSCSGRAACQLPQVPQDQGEVVQAGGDVGVVGAVGGLVDGQGPFQQRPGLRQPGMHLQVDPGPVQQPRVSAHHVLRSGLGSGCRGEPAAASTCGSSTAHRGQACGAPVICPGSISTQQPQRDPQRMTRPVRCDPVAWSSGSAVRAGELRRRCLVRGGRGWRPGPAGAAAARPGSVWPANSRPGPRWPRRTPAGRRRLLTAVRAAARGAAVNKSSGIGSAPGRRTRPAAAPRPGSRC